MERKILSMNKIKKRKNKIKILEQSQVHWIEKYRVTLWVFKWKIKDKEEKV